MCFGTTRVAGRLMCCLVAGIFGTAGTILGTMVGFVSGFINDNGLIQGTLVGAISGALISMEVAESLLKIWCCQEYSMASRIQRMLLVFRNLVVNRLPRASVFPTLSRAVDSQMNANAMQPHFGRAESGDMFEPSYPVLGTRRAAVENLPVMKFSMDDATAGQTTCTICLHDFQAGESGRRLPDCCHVFHLVCVDSWLLWHAECPLCRRAVY